MNHLSDDQLQSYLDRTTEGPSPEIELHLESCPKCREALLHYKLLYRKLSHAETPALSASFKSATLARITNLDKPVAASAFKFVWWWVVGIATSLLIAGYILNLKVLVDAISSFTRGQMAAERVVSSVLSAVTNTVGDDLPVLLFAGMLLLMVALADRILLHRKSHRGGTYLWSV